MHKGPEQGAGARLVAPPQQALASLSKKARPQAYGSSPDCTQRPYQQAVHTDADPQWYEHANAHTTEGT